MKTQRKYHPDYGCDPDILPPAQYDAFDFMLKKNVETGQTDFSACEIARGINMGISNVYRVLHRLEERVPTTIIKVGPRWQLRP